MGLFDNINGRPATSLGIGVSTIPPDFSRYYNWGFPLQNLLFNNGLNQSLLNTSFLSNPYNTSTNYNFNTSLNGLSLNTNGQSFNTFASPLFSAVTNRLNNNNYGSLLYNLGNLSLVPLETRGLDGSTVSETRSSDVSNNTSDKTINSVSTNTLKGLQTLLEDLGVSSSKASNISSIIGKTSDVIGSFLPEKTEYSGEKGELTLTLDTVYDGISDAAMAFGPIGMMIGGIMKGGKLLGLGVNALGGGTDGMTNTDAILGSSFLNLTPIGLVNGFGGAKTDTMAKDELAFENIGASYTGANQVINSALYKSGKKYGLLSRGAMNRANREILKAKGLQLIISSISDDAYNRFSAVNSMAAINGNRRALLLQGGYDPASIRIGRNGIKLAKKVLEKYKNNLEKYKDGGLIQDPYQVYFDSLPDDLKDSTDFRVRDYWKFNGEPKDFDEAVSKGMFIKEKDGWHSLSVSENPETGEIEFMKSSSHPTHLKELDWYYSDDGAEFRSLYDLVKSEPYWKYVKKETLKYERGGTLLELVEIEPEDSIEELKQGGILLEMALVISEELEDSIEEVMLVGIDPEEDIQEYKEGGSLESLKEIKKYSKPNYEKWIKTVPKNRIDNNYDLETAYNLLPFYQLETWRTATKKELDKGEKHLPSCVEMEDGIIMFLKKGLEDPNKPDYNPEVHFELDQWFDPNEHGWYDYGRQYYDLVYKDGRYWYVPKEITEEFINKLAEGGKFNIIPEGALHARLHHMENADNLTKKGIPVVSENENGELLQLAEIEKEEIIFRLEVTKKLEELAKDGSDEAAIEAGKILVEEILNNTIDNTNRLL